MSIYVFDANVFIHLFDYYYESRFPTLWERFNHAINIGQIISVREVKNEIDGHFKKERRINQWARMYSKIFLIPSEEEMLFIQEIFKIDRFQSVISKRNRLEGKPVADPFIIARAKITNSTVVTNEANHPDGAKIPNICQYFRIKCIDLEKFMEIENWTF